MVLLSWCQRVYALNNLLSFFQGLRKRGILEVAAGGLTGPRAQLESVSIGTTPMHVDGNDLQSKVLWSNQNSFSKAVKAQRQIPLVATQLGHAISSLPLE